SRSGRTWSRSSKHWKTSTVRRRNCSGPSDRSRQALDRLHSPFWCKSEHLFFRVDSCARPRSASPSLGKGALAKEVRADFLMTLSVASDPRRPRWNKGDVFEKLFPGASQVR